MATKSYNFRLDEETIESLDSVAQALGSNRSAVLRQAIVAAGGMLMAAREQVIANLTALREKEGDDTILGIKLVAADDGSPRTLASLSSGKPLEGVTVRLAGPIEGQMVLFLDVHDVETRSLPLRFGSESLLVRQMLLPLGELPWPPEPTVALGVRLGDLDQVIAFDPLLSRHAAEAEPELALPVTREIRRLYARLLMTNPELNVSALMPDDWEKIGISEEEGRALLSRPDFPWKEVVSELKLYEFDAKLAEELGMSLELVQEVRKRLYNVAAGSGTPRVTV